MQPTAEKPKPFLVSRIEAARLLNVCLRTLDALLASKELLAVPVRGRVMIDPADIRTFIDNAKGA